MRRRVPRQRGPDSGVPKSPSVAARESLAPLSAASGIGRSPPPTPRPSKNGHVLSLAPLRDLADDLRTLTVDSFKERLVARVFRHPFLAPIVAATLVPFVVLAWPAVLHLFGAPTQPADGRAPLRAVLEMTLFGLYLIHLVATASTFSYVDSDAGGINLDSQAVNDILLTAPPVVWRSAVASAPLLVQALLAVMGNLGFRPLMMDVHADSIPFLHFTFYSLHNLIRIAFRLLPNVLPVERPLSFWIPFVVLRLLPALAVLCVVVVVFLPLAFVNVFFALVMVTEVALTSLSVLRARPGRDEAVAGQGPTIAITLLRVLAHVLLKRGVYTTALLLLILSTCGRISSRLHRLAAYVERWHRTLRNLEGRNTHLGDSIERQSMAMAKMKAVHDETERAVMAKSRFLANMSRMVRRPMNTVVGNASLLLSSSLSPDQEGYVREIDSSADDMMTLIRNVSIFSRAEAGEMAVESGPFSVSTVLEKAVMRASHLINGRDIELVWIAHKNVPSPLIGDEGRVRDILRHLLENSIHYMDGAGEVMVRAQVTKRTGRKATVSVTVSDTGPGIPPEKVKSVFLPFNDSLAGGGEGSGYGLGLPLCSQFAKLLGGNIQCVSEVDVGTSITFTAELGTNHTEDEEANLETSRSPAEAIHASVDQTVDLESCERVAKMMSQRPLVLIADDNDDFRATLAAFLKPFGCEIAMAHDAQSVIAALKSNVDIFFLDASLVVGPPTNDDLSEEVRRAELATAKDLSKAIQAHQKAQRRQKMSIVLMTPPGRARLHGGILTPFTFSKPFMRKDVTDTFASIARLRASPETSRTAPQPQAPAAQPQKPVRSLQVLIAEDDVITQKVFSNLVKRLGHTTSIAQNGLEAVQQATSSQFDVIFMDCHMPQMDGFEATAAIRQHEESTGARRVLIVALTADTMVSVQQQCARVGMDSYLTKPVRRAALDNVLSSPALTTTERHNSVSSELSLSPPPARDEDGDGHGAEAAPSSAKLADVPETPAAKPPVVETVEKVENPANAESAPLSRPSDASTVGGSGLDSPMTVDSPPVVVRADADTSAPVSVDGASSTDVEGEADAGGDQAVRHSPRPVAKVTMAEPDSQAGQQHPFVPKFSEQSPARRSRPPSPVASVDGDEAAVQEKKTLSVLLVEDNLVNAKIATVVLKKNGCVVDHASNGKIGVERFNAHFDNPYDVILMDIHMPVCDGLEATRLVRLAEETSGAPPTPIIALTADMTLGHRAKCIEAGCTEYLNKPVDYGRLMSIISAITGT